MFGSMFYSMSGLQGEFQEHWSVQFATPSYDQFLLFLNVSRVHQSLNMTKTPNLLYTFVSSLKSIYLNEQRG